MNTLCDSSCSLAIVIPAYGAPDALRSTLHSVFAHTVRYRCAVIVVDSGSTSGPVRDAVADFPVEYVPVPNRGFAAACNVGIRLTRAPFVALLNPDVILHDDALGALVDLLEREPGAACAAPRLLRPNASDQPYAYGWEPTPRYLLQRGVRRLVSKDDPTIATRQASPLAVDWVAGTCLVARASAFAEVGLLDERYFLYWEDVDWCLRAARAGWRIVWEPRVAITHLGGASAGVAAPAHYYRSLVRFYRKWYGPVPAWGLRALLRLYAPAARALRRRHAHRP